ncbi:MAG: hypothetical protein PUJ55_05410, partial [Clostridiales bacterium]|nr:hypothetical protein [Clostridiales bacterium]MDY4111803.1 hypothetical protein [Roseburia sp.]
SDSGRDKSKPLQKKFSRLPYVEKKSATCCDFLKKLFVLTYLTWRKNSRRDVNSQKILEFFSLTLCGQKTGFFSGIHENIFENKHPSLTASWKGPK